jgi:KaiC/GvpD/RAD55 family RecA-like ATPase
MNKYQDNISIEVLSLYILSQVQEKEKEIYKNILEEIRKESIDSVIIEDLILELSKKHQAYELSKLALDVSEGYKSFDDLLLFTQNLNASTDLVDPSTGHSIVTDDLDELYNTTYSTTGLRWRCSSLNKSLGSLRKGDFGFIFARPETGKTTFLASEVSYFAEQCDSPILWFNNEEQGSKVKLRIYQASLGIGLTELLNNRDKYGKQFFDKTARKIILNDAANTTKNDVQRLIELYQPGCIVFDQLDKIQGFSGDREDIRLGNIYIWARNIAKQYCPVIGVCQADATGEGKRWLTMDNVASAKTTKQAEADWIIGIGKTHNENEEYFRYLSICKNKLLGDEDTDPILRHGHLTVKINPYVARYED